MKKYILLASSLFTICALGFFFLSTSESSVEETKSPKVLSMTASIDVPDEVTFAGEKIDLSRYDLHERYDREINGFTYLHSSTLLLLKRANRIFPIIVPILKANGVPEDFVYLAVIESMLDPRAVSSAKAAGLWQFMPATGKQFGLEITSEVDERFSIEKSTQAACQYLKSAYNKYGSWSSVAISYNAGMGRVSGELDKQQAEDGVDLWLVEESSRYYFRMLAIKNLFENPYKYGFVLSEDQLYKPMEFKQVEVTTSIPDLAAFAIDNGVSYAQLKDFNSWLRDRKLTISPKSAQSYTLLIPTERSLYYKKGEQVKVYNKNWITK
jgi:membrane-bound lytic murein transglycosylase D